MLKSPDKQELNKDSEIESLSQELFFHFVYPTRTYAQELSSKLLGGGILINFAGRATLQWGSPFQYGPNLIYRIPKDDQIRIVTSRLDPEADSGMVSGRGKMFALQSRFDEPLSSEDRDQITQWLASPHRQAKVDSLSRLPIEEVSSRLVKLDSDYLLGLYNVDEDYERTEIQPAQGLISPLVKNVRCLNPNPMNRISDQNIEKAINYWVLNNEKNVLKSKVA